jgi:excisionase family DNA binding protein/putative nucleotidyltransferase with HDIG domain
MKNGVPPMKETLKTKEAAELLKVTTQTIKNYIYSGRLKALKTPGGHHRIRRGDLMKLGFVGESSQREATLDREQLLNQYRKLFESYLSTVKVILQALDGRDAIAAGHSTRVSRYAMSIAGELGFASKEKEELELAALLHDIGKVGISESILGKPGRLTDQELFLVKRHPEIGESIVKEVDRLKGVGPAIRHHHERYDGAGYPDSLSGIDIPLPSRVIAIAETFDYLRSHLAFRRALSIDEALVEIERSSGTQFDPTIAALFVDKVRRTEETT